MLIVLEGPDGAGKTTLAQKLAAELGQSGSDKIEIWKRAAPTRHPIEEYMTPLFPYRPGTGYHLILDRWHWGEAVYPEIRDRPTQLGDSAWWSIEAYLRRLGALVVHCERETRLEYLNIYRQRNLDGTPDVWQVENLDRIRFQFTRVSYRSQLPGVMHIPGVTAVSEIVNRGRELEERHRVLNQFTTYLGPLDPTTLLVGDVRKPHRMTPNNDGPAFVPFDDTSGLYLLRALAGLPARDWRRTIGIANACDVDDVRALWATLGRPAVVALGQNARRRLDEIGGVPHSVIPHPQYVRRFHHFLDTEYGWLIYRASRIREDHSKWPQSFTETADGPPTSTSSTRSGSSAAADPAATAPPVT